MKREKSFPLTNDELAAEVAALRAAPTPAPTDGLEDVAMAARRGLAFGHQATPQTPERMIERKEQALRQILNICERHGVSSSVLRAPAPDIAVERCGYVHADGWTCGRVKGHPSVHVPPSRMASPPAPETPAQLPQTGQPRDAVYPVRPGPEPIRVSIGGTGEARSETPALAMFDEQATAAREGQ